MRYRVDSEVGELRQVILHRPGREMTRLTPSNKDELLFDDLLWLAEAQAEHDAFANVLRSEGVEVLYFAELLGETLEDTAARKFALEHAFDERAFGPGLTDALWTLAEGSSGWELADLLIAGITKAELLDRVGTPRSVLIDLMDDDDLVLPPLPNHLFTRDTSAWAYGGVAVNSMRKEARRRETLNFETIYTYHPRFATADFQRWSIGDDDGPAVLEGGDVLVTGNGSVVVGLSERSTPQGAERFARRLFESGEAETVVALNMPAKREMMHLDTVLTMLDEDTLTVYQNLGNLPSVTIRPGASPEKLDITRNEDADMFSVIGAAAGIGDPRVLITPQDSLAAQREQWDDGCNFLAIRPGVVIGYERNVTTNEYLTAQGIDVSAVPGSELGRGRGGPRCMSCPTIRDAAPPQKETSL